MRVVKPRSPSNREPRRGAAAVEFAVVLPVLILTVVAGIDVGRFSYNTIAVTNAARAAAGYGSMHPTSTKNLAAWQASVEQAAQDEMTGQMGFDPGKLTFPAAPSMITDGAFKIVEVSVSYPFQTLIKWPFLGKGTPVALTRTVRMRLLR